MMDEKQYRIQCIYCLKNMGTYKKKTKLVQKYISNNYTDEDICQDFGKEFSKGCSDQERVSLCEPIVICGILTDKMDQHERVFEKIKAWRDGEDFTECVTWHDIYNGGMKNG